MKLSRNYLPELLCSADKDRAICNPYLLGAFLFATDGRRIGQFPVEREDGDVDGVIPCSVLVDARESAPGKPVTIACGAMKLGFNSRFGWVEVQRPQLDKAWPVYRSVIAEFPQRKAKQIAMNIDVLTDLADAFGSPSFMLSFDATDAPLIFEPLPEHHAPLPAKSTFGMFMPIKVQDAP